MGGIVIELGWPAKELSPNARVHHMARYRFAKASKDTAYWVTRAALGHDKFTATGEIIVRIAAHPPKGRVRPDADNLLASMKSAIDGIALGLGVNDNLFRPVFEWAEPHPNGKLVIEVGS